MVNGSTESVSFEIEINLVLPSRTSHSLAKIKKRREGRGDQMTVQCI